MKIVNEADDRQVTGAKGSIFYRAHSYHTKLPPEGLTPLLDHYTDPGDSVLDPFCGSGMTGVACRLSGRNGVLSDLSPAAVHIANGYASAGAPEGLHRASKELLALLAGLESLLYSSSCHSCGGPARIEYTVWSDVFPCPGCHGPETFWVTSGANLGKVGRLLKCPHCAYEYPKSHAVVAGQLPVEVSLSCITCGRHRRVPDGLDLELALWAHREATDAWYPVTPFEPWREMWRGQHNSLGIDTAADFFTQRNLRALAETWSQIGDFDGEVGAQLRFAFTAIVNRASRRYQWNAKRPTNVLSGTMYVASLSYEFNVFSLFRRKLKVVEDLARALDGSVGSAQIRLSSATNLEHLENNSIDYVLTDPPFGSNIYYSDASFLWESWLEQFTDTRLEAVVSSSLKPDDGGKTLMDYESLMSESFAEMRRVLRPEAWASIVFHNSDDAVWSALERALESAGLVVEGAVAFDKNQPSFKGVKQLTAGERVASFDLVLHARVPRRGRRQETVPADLDKAVLERVGALLEMADRRSTTPYVHSYVMRVLLQNGWPVAGYSYRRVEEMLEQNFQLDGATWRTPEAVADDS